MVSMNHNNDFIVFRVLWIEQCSAMTQVMRFKDLTHLHNLYAQDIQ